MAAEVPVGKQCSVYGASVEKDFADNIERGVSPWCDSLSNFKIFFPQDFHTSHSVSSSFLEVLLGLRLLSTPNPTLMASIHEVIHRF